VSLNIKNPEARRLAKEVAKRAGETMTRAVIEGLRERLSRLNSVRKRETTAEELLAIGRRCAATLKHNPPDHAALLYDERGLPR
jgi:antitoxin VapB